VIAAALLLLGRPDAQNETLLQRVQIEGQSAEGGEGRLILRKNGGKESCRIAATYFGETGRAEYVFDFDPILRSATRTEIRYSGPITVEPLEIRSRRTENLESKEAKASFAEHRALFGAEDLARCGKAATK
jgi:hypothetical protein